MRLKSDLTDELTGIRLLPKLRRWYVEGSKTTDGLVLKAARHQHVDEEKKKTHMKEYRETSNRGSSC
jgi:hypothetical protein